MKSRKTPLGLLLSNFDFSGPQCCGKRPFKTYLDEVKNISDLWMKKYDILFILQLLKK